MVGWQRLEQEVRGTENGGEQVVEIVRDAAREPSHRLHLLGLPQLVLEQAMLGDVLHDDGEMRDAAVGLAHHSSGLPHRNLLTVLAFPHRLVGDASRHHDGVEEPLPVLGSGKDVRREAPVEQLGFRRITEHADQRRIDGEQAAVGRAAENAVGRRLDERAVRRFRFSQRVFGPLALNELPDLAAEGGG